MGRTEAELTSLPVHVSLQDRELWDKFSGFGTEMLITKSGRYALMRDWYFYAWCHRPRLKCMFELF